MMGEIVVNDQHVAAQLHEMLRDAGCGVWGDVGEARRIVPFGDNRDGVIHRVFFQEGGHGLRDGGSPLADGAINAHNILAMLIKDGVDRNGGFARLPVT
jgi:hypothetical protein